MTNEQVLCQKSDTRYLIDITAKALFERGEVKNMARKNGKYSPYFSAILISRVNYGVFTTILR